MLYRAIYSRAKHILIDDALSAVDANTAKHLINECIYGPLMDKRTRILVTHHLSLTSSVADYMVSFNILNILHFIILLNCNIYAYH